MREINVHGQSRKPGDLTREIEINLERAPPPPPPPPPPIRMVKTFLPHFGTHHQRRAS